ncbi:MAG: alginate export family protein [Sulfurimonas sp.]|uniref:alginate export family protein n=1 Tax=Sulfurimonas sp. TaxID=2022749 RepID=UPI00260C13E5|nr:alginate export family protein [Sulfurimonas sp.]MDD3476587.1 alginate export family protein [Sulfurimonas sp.]
MKKVIKKFLPLLLLASSLYAEFDYDGQVRLRYESFDNMNEKYYGTKPALGEAHDSYLMSRIQLGLIYNFNDNWNAKISMQDARVFDWGFSSDDWYNKEFEQVHSTQSDFFELHETFLQYKDKNVVVTAGRQKITYGDLRVFGPGEWKNSGKWIWDAIKVSLRDGDNFVDFFYGAMMLHDPDQFSLNHRHGYYGAGMYGHYAYKKNAAIEPILAYKLNDKRGGLYDSLESYYAGARAYDTDLYNWFYDMTYIKSFGDKTKLDYEKVSIDGIGIHADGGYNFKSIDTKLGLGYTYASGDDPNTKDDETFDSVFGASDKYYGRLNIMQWVNIKDYELFAIYEPNKKTSIKFEYHKFYADEPTNKWLSYTISTMQDDHYGDEIDIFGTYKYSQNIDLLLGVGYFMSGGYIKEAMKTRNDISDENAFGLVAQFTYSF